MPRPGHGRTDCTFMNIQQLIIDKFLKELRIAYEQMYGGLESHYADVITWTGHLALENIANSDMLYHNMEHTVMVTLAGQAILRGKHLVEGGVRPKDWTEFLIAALCHDIGYVKGVLKRDGNGEYDAGSGDQLVALSDDGTDAVLTPYHVDRSKAFVRERFGKSLLIDLDAEVIAGYIEMTRFPPPDDAFHRDTTGLGGLLRAADLIGQLGDPNYLRKIPALYYEFIETGAAERAGYSSPGQMRQQFSQFYWNMVLPYVKDAMRLLRVTQDGKLWVGRLHSHVFDTEHGDFAAHGTSS